jgi:4-amino-4-deoxy-L-arabinose transferase-like glycosyltransferase
MNVAATVRLRAMRRAPARLRRHLVAAPASHHRERLAWIALAVVFAFSMFWGIRSFGIQDNNEGIYAEIAREMNLRHDWVVPHLDGEPYLEKPPLLYWLVSSLMRVFGEHEWVVRLGPVLCFAGTLGAVVWLGRQIRSVATGRNAAFLLCSAAGVVGMSRSLLFDGPLTCALAWALAFFLDWRIARSRWSLRACYALLAVGVMAKGLVALVLGGGTILAATWLGRRSWREMLALFDPIGVGAFALVVIPWHVLASLREPGFAQFYFINEHVRRFLGSRVPHDFYTGPLYYYLIRVPLYLGVWVFALPALVPKRGAVPVRRTRAESEGRRLLGCFVALAFAFFSVSEGKANYYLLSIMPAVALLVVLHWPHDGLTLKRMLSAAAGVAVFGLAFASAPRVLARKPELAQLLAGEGRLLDVTAALLLLLAVTIALLAWRGRNQAAFWGLTAAGLVVLLPLPELLKRADQMLSGRAVAQFLAVQGDAPIVLYRDYEKLSSVVFYVGHPVPVVDSESNELYYAHQRYAHTASFLEADQLRALSRAQRVWLVAKPCHVDEVARRFASEHVQIALRLPRAVVLSLGPGDNPPRLAASATRSSSGAALPPSRSAASAGIR